MFLAADKLDDHATGPTGRRPARSPASVARRSSHIIVLVAVLTLIALRVTGVI